MRIHFTVADVARVRMVTLGPLAELQLSLRKLQQPGSEILFMPWRTRAASGARLLPPDLRDAARFLAPPSAPLVDLFTLVGAADSYAEGIDRLCQAPAGPLDREFALAPTAASARSPWITGFAHGDRTARPRLTGALADYHALAIAPYWSRIRRLLDNERAARTAVMVAQGLDAMLAGLAPTLRWSPPVLEVSTSPRTWTPGDRTSAITEIHLRGRGVLLAPSLFTDADDLGLYTPWNDDPALLIYPVDLDASTSMRLWQPAEQAGDVALARLLGTTRAAALRVIADGCTTTGLARRLGITPGGASQHATVLREAGLVVSHRHRNTVRHALTSLGVELLNAT
ncbi:hypothetical protein [Micromonospora sp. NPDC051141]|uniref:hypothetical protein n=1 Tax=Micromonospora sp. NPDC051141 TaxID=3364284 RepID=UPI0037A17364